MTVEKEKNLTLLIRICLILCAIEWIVFAALHLFQSSLSVEGNRFGNLVVFLMIGNAILFGLGAWLIEKKGVQISLALWLLINFILTFTDDFGLMDLLNSILVGFVFCLLMIKTCSNRKKLKED